ncbi:MAG TPA: hypothetical protein PLH70_03885 [Bacteroidales bacterium]|nr:hypothetical protein [Bacteroidales bacterium]HOH22001.1 hypothetical protein [Bacteroidales bacterium]HPZ03467.1 hypothetical protein [Bacteroidales bacterium]HQB74923.1 hypothetical protein [Bacteroidales bacterium]
MFSIHNLSPRQNIPEWGNKLAKREAFSAPQLFEGRNKKEEGRIKGGNRKAEGGIKKGERRKAKGEILKYKV